MENQEIETIENILRDKILELSEYLKSHCHNNEQIELITKKLDNLKNYEIMLFISFLNINKVNEYCDQFIDTYKIEETEQIRETIKDYILYFISIRDLISETVK